MDDDGDLDISKDDAGDDRVLLAKKMILLWWPPRILLGYLMILGVQHRRTLTLYATITRESTILRSIIKRSRGGQKERSVGFFEF